MAPHLRDYQPLRPVALWWHSLSPPALFVASFALLIALGTAGLLLLPGLYTGAPLSPLDAAFTMTSAVCVTGLIVVDTATWFTFWGQLWLLLFIQLGGLGLFTLSTLIIGAMGRRLSLRSEMIAGPPIEVSYRHAVADLTVRVARFTFAIEAGGALALWTQFVGEHGFLGGLWHAVFHSVSAFCNAGFSTFSDSLMGQARSPLVIVPITLLVIVGGFGYLATEEAQRWWKAGGPKGELRLSSHTWAAAVATAVLLAAGTALFALFEWHGVLGQMGPVDKLVNAWSMSVMPRTAGFNSIAYPQVSNASAYLTVILMVIGGSPGSTAGGIKTTAAAVLVALAISRVRGRRYVSLHDRSVPNSTVQRTTSLALVAFVVLSIAVFMLSFSEAGAQTSVQERASFLPQLFETASALGTVGLSMDLTPTLSSLGKLLVIVLMFMGRVGPLAFFAALSLKSSSLPGDFRPAREDLIVG